MPLSPDFDRFASLQSFLPRLTPGLLSLYVTDTQQRIDRLTDARESWRDRRNRSQYLSNNLSTSIEPTHEKQ